MSSLVLDTHALIWALLDRSRLSPAALAALETANRANSQVYVPTICLVEITYLLEKGRLPAEVKARLMDVLDNPNSNLKTAALDREVADHIGQIPRNVVPDMPDRIIAATAVHLGLPLISRDQKIRTADLTTIW